MNLKNLLTILIPTCFTGSTSTSLIEWTIASIRGRLRIDAGICDHIIYYDHKEDDNRHKEHEENLRSLANELNMSLISKVDVGLTTIVKETVNAIKTPYLLLLEHDWSFFENIKICDIIEAFEENCKINYVRFNKYENVGRPPPKDCPTSMHDSIKPEFDIKNCKIELLKTNLWSNNPCIFRVSKYKKDWMPLTKPQPGSGGHEMEITAKYWEDIRKYGFDMAHREWGCYIYGRLGDNPTIYHLDGDNQNLWDDRIQI